MFKKFISILILFSLLLSTTAFAQESKICYVNMRKVIHSYGKMKEFQLDFEAKEKKARDEADRKINELRKLKDEMDLLSDKAKVKKQEELTKKQTDFDNFRRQKSEELLKLRDTKIREINEDVINATREFAKENGYTMVFDQMALVYAAENYDVTEDIIKKLNQ